MIIYISKIISNLFDLIYYFHHYSNHHILIKDYMNNDMNHIYNIQHDIFISKYRYSPTFRSNFITNRIIYDTLNISLPFGVLESLIG